MFRALLYPSSGARNYAVDYHIGRFVLGLLYVGGKVRLGWSSVWAAGYVCGVCVCVCVCEWVCVCVWVWCVCVSECVCVWTC